MERVAHGVAQGFNGTLFAYGQTGSGKTYTMGGSASTLSFTALPSPANLNASTAEPSSAGSATKPPLSPGAAPANASSVSGNPTASMPPSVSPATLKMPPPPPLLRPAAAAAAYKAAQPTPSGLPAVASFGVETGVIPRAVSTVLAHAIARREQGWEFILTATYVEIYNERIRDLLAPANDNLKVCK